MRPHRHRRSAGQVLVVVALVGIVLFGVAAIALDQGIARSERRDLQAYADSAALAGARQYSHTGNLNEEHYVAMQYLAARLGFSLPVTNCTTSASCAAGTFSLTNNYTVIFTDSTNNFDVSVQHGHRSLVAGILGFSTTVAGTGGRAAPGAFSGDYALAALNGYAEIHGGGVKNDPSGVVTGPVYGDTGYGSNNAPHAPNLNATACGLTNHVDVGGSSNPYSYNWTGGTGNANFNVPPPDTFKTDQPTEPAGAPTFTSALSPGVKDGSGNWNPGYYSGFAPSGGKYNPGVYDIQNLPATTFTIGQNANPGTAGQPDPAGAVAFVLDSSDSSSSSVDINAALLNGYEGTTDTKGTRNFAVWGGSYMGGLVKLGPKATTTITGILYMPNSDMTYDGNSNPTFYGVVYVRSFTLNGGGNGTQTFNFICGLQAINPERGGLVR